MVSSGSSTPSRKGMPVGLAGYTGHHVGPGLHPLGHHGCLSQRGQGSEGSARGSLPQHCQAFHLWEPTGHGPLLHLTAIYH